METIQIYDGEKVISRIFAGRRTNEVLDCLESCAPCGSAHGSVRPVYVVCDENVMGLAEAVMRASCESQGNFAFREMFPLKATEQSKVMSTVVDMTSWLLGCGADRNALLLAFGGGITTDMAGFAASIYKRGIGFAFVPTTLLAQVDAAIGGKTGVNYDSYKNMLGVIRQPEFTYICPEVLETLPVRDIFSGASELVKSFIIEDGGNYSKAVAFLSGFLTAVDKPGYMRENRDRLMDLVVAAAAVKAGVVSRDQFENGERRKLNLGHTFAHSIEWNARKADMDITHGEAVAMGIVLAARLSERLGIARTGLAAGIERDFVSSGLPVVSPFGPGELVSAMSKDKKAEDGIVHFVLMEDIGKVVMRDLVAADAAGLLLNE